MKKRILTVLTLALLVIFAVFTFSACDLGKSKEQNDKNGGKEDITVCFHEYENGKCKFCGESAPSVGLKYTLKGTGYEVSKGTCTDTDIVIPSSYNGKPVTSIGDWAFEDCISLTSITIPNSVTSIGHDAFYNCRSLTSVRF